MVPTFCAICVAKEPADTPSPPPLVGSANAGDGDLEGLGDPNRELFSSSSEAMIGLGCCLAAFKVDLG